MTASKQGRLSVHPYLGGTTSNLIANVSKNGGVDRAHVATLLATLLGTLLTLPLRALESVLYGGAIRRLKLPDDPIFIVGHWRSGTTHLHNLISQDRRLGFLTTLQALLPTCSVVVGRTGFLKQMLARLVPAKRMMDNVTMHLDYPQEEEFSVSCITTSAHHCNHFPRTIRDSFEKYVLFNVDEGEKNRWKEAYLSVIKKATYMAGGRRLILKNPYNTARIKILLELFPNAKFIHIYRNPYNIYLSALHDFIKEAEEMALQEFTEAEFAELCYELYPKLMKAYWDARDLVPKGNITEVAYEALEEDPMREVTRMYRELNLELPAEVQKDMFDYLASIKHYKKNKYSYSATMAQEIGKRWQSFIERLQYAPPVDIRVDNDARWSCQIET